MLLAYQIADERAVQLAKERDQRKTLEQKEQDEIQKLGVMENTANDMAADILSGLDFLEGEQKAASAAADADGWNVVPARRGSTRKNRNNSESENTHQRVHRSNSNAIRKESMPKGRQRSTSAAGRNMNQARGSTGQKGSTPSALRR
ncbi:hypothetical protein SARC_08036 [Sphaeroforma arctica JP610]|uniref:Uncharacterized protein n=1 Tax=Sphaeroforma arctica JP610 TaxID=667725 RepID=A0A0L0FS62_9EUKA|nr:hypothetical protein SARC_08036 [Sphaeroforma arctica JP610]KNC79575.1 hypothetical protein SARC_08036 [Sphaeroforma arctica JP610]|eukprot:XP_014153477.1 hypothetical protein SARC_08036 [Sphaeroforma arctica JP610]